MMKGGLDDDEGPESALRKLIQTHGVAGYVVLNKTGVPLKYHGMESSDSSHLAALISELTIATQEFMEKSRLMLQSTPAAATVDDCKLQALRLRSQNAELVVTPEDNYTLVVVHTAQKARGMATMAAVEKAKVISEESEKQSGEDGGGVEESEKQEQQEAEKAE